ncbi:hypothetical protein RJT34_16451 [Clitoria ternatea]|uniref:Non-haem dioxygenase N-terminal domain-containing protein n=1 Tax=Clitoria ternatea TaxID=43366 RepID=A0AAN9PCB7_CLITE
MRDGNEVKGLVDTGILEVPERYIQPLQERIMDKYDSRVCDVPPIDLSKLNGPKNKKVMDEIVRATETLGFFQVVNHGTITTLLQDGIGGLYVKVEDDNNAKNGEWLEIPPIPGALVINIDDILQVW